MKTDRKIEYRLERWGKSVLFQVEWMDKRFLWTERGAPSSRSYRATNGVQVASGAEPELRVEDGKIKSIWLQGYIKNARCEIQHVFFHTLTAAAQAKEQIEEALRDWAKNWEGWKEEGEKATDEPHILRLEHGTFRIEQINRSVLFLVLGMDEQFREKTGQEFPEHHAPNGLCVISNVEPDIEVEYEETIALRGYGREQDEDPVVETFDTKEEAREAAEKIKEALRDWDQNWAGWKE